MCSLGRTESQPTPSLHSSCSSCRACSFFGAENPRGSNKEAMRYNILLRVNGLCGRLSTILKVSLVVLHLRPSVPSSDPLEQLTVVLAVDFSLTGRSSKTSGKLEFHFSKRNPPLANVLLNRLPSCLASCQVFTEVRQSST